MHVLCILYAYYELEYICILIHFVRVHFKFSFFFSFLRCPLYLGRFKILYATGRTYTFSRDPTRIPCVGVCTAVSIIYIYKLVYVLASMHSCGSKTTYSSVYFLTKR